MDSIEKNETLLRKNKWFTYKCFQKNWLNSSNSKRQHEIIKATHAYNFFPLFPPSFQHSSHVNEEAHEGNSGVAH